GTERPWTVPIRVEDVPETGRRVDLMADESTRASLAEAAGGEWGDAARSDLRRDPARTERLARPRRHFRDGAADLRLHPRADVERGNRIDRPSFRTVRRTNECRGGTSARREESAGTDG